jgi:outer membrane protein
MHGPGKLTKKWRHIEQLGLVLLALVLLPTAARATDLLDVYKLALSNDPTYLAAKANYNAEREKLGVASSVLWPHVYASANVGWNDINSGLIPVMNPLASAQQTYSNSGYAITLSEPLFDWEAFAAVSQAHAGVRQATAVFEAQREGLFLRVAGAYFHLLLANDNLGLAKSQEAAISQQREVAQGRLKVGLGTITEVDDANARYQMAAAQELQAQNNLADAQQAMREIAGNIPPKLLKLRDDIPLQQPTPADINQWVTKALSQNYQVVAAKEGTVIAKREISRQHAGAYPKLNVVGRYFSSNNIGAEFGISGANETGTSVGLQLTVPIFQGGLVHKLSKSAGYTYEAAQQNLEATRRHVEREVRDAYLGISSGASRVSALKQAVVASKSALEAKKTGYEAGINTNLQVLDAQRDLYQAQRDYAAARYDYVFSELRLKQAAGTLSETDLAQINSWLQ